MTLSAITVLVINVAINIQYCYLIYKKKIQPALAMWLFFVIAVSISLATYLAQANYSPLDNIFNTSDVLLVTIVMVYILLRGEKSSRFTRFDYGCLVAVALIVFFWAITGNHFITNLAVQAIMVIAYFPVIKRMLTAKKNTESFLVWFATFSLAGISLFSSKGTLATIYAIRAMGCTGLLLLLMLRIEYLNRKAIPQEVIADSEN